MKPKTMFVYLLTFMILSAPAAFGADAGDKASGIITGSVRNKTTGEKAIGGIEVTLYQHIQDQVSEIGRTQTDPTGGFIFRGIHKDKDRAYHILVRYKDIGYFSEMQNFQGKNEIDFEVAVFEITDQKKDIRIKTHHVLLETLKDGLAFREIMIIENKGNRSYVGAAAVGSDKRHTLRISLPAEAIDVQLMNPSLVNTAAGLIDTSVIIPGPKRVLFSYRIRPTLSTYKFEKDISLDTDGFNFIFPENGVQATSDQLEMKGPTENHGQRLFYLSGNNLKQGSKIEIKLKRPKTYAHFKIIISGLVALVIATAFILPLIKKKSHGGDEYEEHFNPKEMNLSEQRQTVLQAIADLDDLFEDNEMDAATYHTKRAQMLSNAKALTKQLNSDRET
jgi:hypothetical protein